MSDQELMLKLLQEVRDEVKDLNARFDSHSEAAAAHEIKDATRHAELLSAFPQGNIEGHRRYHQSIVEWCELRNQIIRECLMNAAKVGTVAAAAWLAYAIWTVIIMEIKR